MNFMLAYIKEIIAEINYRLSGMTEYQKDQLMKGDY